MCSCFHLLFRSFFFFFNDTATTEIYTLSLHDALPVCVYGLITYAVERWPSTWSGPSCASSSTAKIAVEPQNRECETASTSRPKARSLSATIAPGRPARGVVPAVWSRGRYTNCTVGIDPCCW